MDALSEVLKVLKLNSGLFLEAEFTAPWCIDSAPGTDDVRHILPDAEQVSIYHLVTEGRCRAALPGTDETVELHEGDLIMFPHGDGHRLGSDLQLAPVGAEVLVEPSPEGGLARINHGGGGARTRFVCGFLACDKRLCRPLLGALPRMLRVELGDGPASAWITATLRHGASETHAPRPGSDALLGRLSELLFVEAIRHYTASLPQEQLGWLAGLRDPFVGKALALLHAEPARDWEVEELARQSGLSRSALNERFNALIGEPPMQYLTGWRLALASQALASSNDAVARIAERVGYDSEAAFNRAFKREFGVPPAAWRRSVRATRNRGNEDPGE
jgi:AraC-like DNA-binding protein